MDDLIGELPPDNNGHRDGVTNLGGRDCRLDQDNATHGKQHPKNNKR